jgi:hypothetical protein
MKHVGILAHSTEGAALCFLTLCQEGFRRLGRNEHPDVTLDHVAPGQSSQVRQLFHAEQLANDAGLMLVPWS